MEKIMIIGSPGSGKSTLARKLNDILGIPVLHLDYIYHIDNNNQITREELRRRIKEFALNNDSFIIDGNYKWTMEYRMGFVDTIILLDIPTEICIKNVLQRKSEPQRSDMAPGFDNSIMDDDFLDFIRNFEKEKLPDIYKLINNSGKKIFVLKSMTAIENFITSIKTQN